ncbi:MAG: O-methyltransferase [Planctomycetota bacterium]|nr:O-methyltransferase [Planctomycetota bacterium]
MSGKTMWAVAMVAAFAGIGTLVAYRSDRAPDVMPAQGPSVSPDEPEKRILNVLDQMLVGPYSEILSVPPDDGKVLRLLAEATGAKNIVEIGTSNGYAALWFCLALRTTGGKLTTFEIDPERVLLALQNFERAGVNKLVTIIEGDAHKTVTKLKEPIDIVFLDADKGGNLDYLNKLLPLVRPGGLILAHDTTDSAERMRDYLDAVTTNPALETIFLHKQGPGIGVTLKKRQPGN